MGDDTSSQNVSSSVIQLDISLKLGGSRLISEIHWTVANLWMNNLKDALMDVCGLGCPNCELHCAACLYALLGTMKHRSYDIHSFLKESLTAIVIHTAFILPMIVLPQTFKGISRILFQFLGEYSFG